MDLCTIADVYLYLNLDFNPSDSDNTTELIAKLIPAIKDRIERLTGRDFEQQDHTEKHHGNKNNSIVLKQYPVNSVTSVSVGGSALSSDGFEWTTAGIIYFIGDFGSFNSFSKFPFGKNNITVEYNAGFSDSTLPADLNMLACEMVAQEFRKSKVNSAVKSEKLGDYSYSLGSAGVTIDVLESQKAVLARYKNTAMNYPVN